MTTEEQNAEPERDMKRLAVREIKYFSNLTKGLRALADDIADVSTLEQHKAELTADVAAITRQKDALAQERVQAERDVTNIKASAKAAAEKAEADLGKAQSDLNAVRREVTAAEAQVADALKRKAKVEGEIDALVAKYQR